MLNDRKEKEERQDDSFVDTNKHSWSEMYLNDIKKAKINNSKLAKELSKIGGSKAFLVCFFLVLGVWLGLDLLHPFGVNFDPYPFVFLNLFLGCLSAIQAPIVIRNLNKKAKINELNRIKHDEFFKREERELKKIKEHLHNQDGKMDNMLNYLISKH